MSLIHRNKSWFDSDSLGFDRATYSIAKNYDPLISNLFNFCNKHAVFTTSSYFLKSSHILNMLFIDDSIPEDNAHIIAFWFSKSKDQSVIEVGPHVLRLDIRE